MDLEDMIRGMLQSGMSAQEIEEELGEGEGEVFELAEQFIGEEE